MSEQMKNEENTPEQLYADIISLPHYEPRHHPRMAMWNRAAQFAPFAALTGFDAVISEAGRPTESWTDMGDGDGGELNRKMEELRRSLPEHRNVTIAYFQPDAHKAGGAYLTVTGEVRLINEHERLIELKDGRTIPIDRIRDMSMT